MSISTVLSGVFIVLAAIGILIAVKLGYSKNKRALVGGITLAVIMILALIIIPKSIHTVDTGEVAVVKVLGEAKGIRTAGTHFDFWLTNTYQIYDAKVQNIDIQASSYSSDAQTMNAQMTLQYQIMGEKVMDIAAQYGSLEILQNRIQSIAIEKAKSVLSSYKAMDIISQRANMSPAVEEAIKEAVGTEYFVNITTVVLTNIDFSDAFEQAVEEKMIAEQNKLKAEYENETIVAKAKAEAEAKLTAAKAEAEANKALEESLTDKILQEMYLTKWDGKLPSVMTGTDGINVMLPVTPDTAE